MPVLRPVHHSEDVLNKEAIHVSRQVLSWFFVTPCLYQVSVEYLPWYAHLSLIHISEPTRLGMISYAVFCLKKKKKTEIEKKQKKKKKSQQKQTKKIQKKI